MKINYLLRTAHKYEPKYSKHVEISKEEKHMQKIKYQIKLIHILLITLSFSIQSCNKSSKRAEATIEEWLNKEIRIPKNITFKSMGRDTACTNILNHRHKVLVYLDSLGCIPCRLRLVEWKEYIDNCQLKGSDVGFLFVVQSSNYKHLEEKLYTDLFFYPIIYDSKNEFDKLNKFPKEERFRTFLLDARNRVVLVGSPIENEKIHVLYDEVIGARKKAVKQESSCIDKTEVQLTKDSLSLGKFSYSLIKNCSFVLKNNGEIPLIIQSVRTSCGCTVAKYDKKPIAKGESTTVVLEYKPNSLGYFRKTADVLCNVPEGYIRLTISGEVVK